ncbi:hypothetical protein AL755_10380 [Arthrobacter sp. ERGS1:01]|uniref:NAD-dependent epimerase/dehydratase family protein n=1 Tax=Arthrobacter sp. ERGS1:01 TaxID=1704044 RepID=UPI0006CB664D|nr:NAD-dependent epimerase/dehydratase family protein [Arthrobacter sp. ERGS1:01]ALE05782.1 hypothetical protein AL755_10380 [Arthrobacter sp. ERGS1:01]
MTPASIRGGKNPTVLVLGGSGFIGSRVVSSIAASGIKVPRVLSRRPDEMPLVPNAITVRGDITEAASLAPALSGVDTVVHCAAYVGSDPQLAREINEAGTHNVIEQSRRAGVRRIIYLSTTAVYGSGPHRGVDEEAPGYHPASAASAGRAVAERLVLDGGGEVVRPNLVVGRGDRWVVPGLLKMMACDGGWPGDGSANLSIVTVEDLSALIGGLVLAPANPGRAHHGAYPEPITAAELLGAIAAAFNVPGPRYTTTGKRARAALERAGFSAHQIDMVTADHWYRSGGLWELAGLTPPAPLAALRKLAAAYPALRRPGKENS